MTMTMTTCNTLPVEQSSLSSTERSRKLRERRRHGISLFTVRLTQQEPSPRVAIQVSREEAIGAVQALSRSAPRWRSEQHRRRF
jgi:hypothetical protein